MADPELAKILSKRSKIIEDDEEKKTQENEHPNEFRQNMGEPNSDLLANNLKNCRPTPAPKPRFESNNVIQKDKKQEISQDNSEIESSILVPRHKTPPLKPPRTITKPETSKHPSPVNISPKTSNSSDPHEPPQISTQQPNDFNSDEFQTWKPIFRVWNPFIEFKEISRKELHKYLQEFQKFDKDSDKHLDFEELKQMLEGIGHPQTHVGLKGIMKELDEDKDNKISFREFLQIFKKAKNNELAEGSGLLDLFNHINEIDVEKEGVNRAKHFFEAKISKLIHGNAFEEEIKQEQLDKKEALEDKKRKKAAFDETRKMFQH